MPMSADWTYLYVDKARSGPRWAVWPNSGHGRGRTVGRTGARYAPSASGAIDLAKRWADDMRKYPEHYGEVTVKVLPYAQRTAEEEAAQPGGSQ